MIRLLLYFLLLLPILANAQVKDESKFLNKWEEVERLIAIKNYEQTKPLLHIIRYESKKYGKSDQWIRAVVAESQLMKINTNDDDTFVKIKNHFEQAIKEGSALEKSILNNYLAMYLWSNANRYNTTITDAFVKANGKNKLSIIDSLFQLSITNKELLVSNDMTKWEGLLEKNQNLSLTPSLYHFLGYQYRNFLSSVENSNKENSNKLNNDLIATSTRQKQYDALNYLLANQALSTTTDTKELMKKYQDIINAQQTPYNAYLLYEIAKIQTQKNQKQESLLTIEKTLKDYPTSPWISNVVGLKNSIIKSTIKIHHSLFSPANQYTPFKISSRNTNKVFIRVYNVTNTPKTYKKYEAKYDSISQLTSVNAKLQYEDNVELKSFQDFKTHQTIYKLNPLPYGKYIILYSNNKEFKNNGVEYTTVLSDLIVSDVFMSATQIANNNKKDEYKALLINRNTGLPYANKTVELYEVTNDKLKLIRKTKTNAGGEFNHISNKKNDYNEIDDNEIYLPTENQLIDLQLLKNIPNHTPEDVIIQDYSSSEMVTMLDRSIYRPGQKVYFKSIYYNNHETKGNIIPNAAFQAILYDANNQKIDSLSVTTNEFGSANGVFTLPSKTLLGSFRIQFTSDNKERYTQYFKVEEYKRPTFKVEFETNKNTYTRTDKEGSFIGQVAALNGAILEGASVKYTIKFYNANLRKNIEYAAQTIYTDDKGKFSIPVNFTDTIFNNLTNFSLSFYAEVTNQTGEMQSATSSYNFSLKPWRIKINTNSLEEEGKWDKLYINTTNQNNDHLKFAGEVSIFRIEEPTKPLDNFYTTYFKNIEYHLLTNEQYENYFPKYFDSNNIKPDNKKFIKKYTFDTNDTSLVQIDPTLFPKGKYWIHATSIQGKDTINASANISIYDKTSYKVTNNQLFSYKLNKTSYTENDTVVITFYTDNIDTKKLYLFESLAGKQTKTQLLDWKNGETKYSFVLTAAHISPTISFQSLLVINNQIVSNKIFIPIYKAQKSLTLQTNTFRDKITPGQKEKWSFKITQKDQKSAAELIATMYDASLDQFASNTFNSTLPLYYNYYRSEQNFYHLVNEFQQNAMSGILFDKNTHFVPVTNNLATVRSYQLWPEFNKYQFRTIFNSNNDLEEVVVVGYTPRRKEVMTGSVATINGNMMQDAPAANFTDLLQGRVPGLNLQLNNGTPGIRGDMAIRGISSIDFSTGTSEEISDKVPLYIIDGKISSLSSFRDLETNDLEAIEVLKDEIAISRYGAKGINGVIHVLTKAGKAKGISLANFHHELASEELNSVNVRTNLQETAFFYPTLYTDTNGDVSFEFDSPEALTQWKLLLFAHTKDLAATSTALFAQTQKQLMVRPNLPRYFREGDKIIIKAQIQNLSKNAQKGNAKIELINPENNEIVSSSFVQDSNIKSFEIAEAANTTIEWTLNIPSAIHAVQVKIVAATDEFSDGEMQELAILSNRILVAETQQITLKPTHSDTYTIHSKEKDNLQARIQIQTNPILEIIAGIDYLKNYPYECSEQLASKWFGLKMVQYINKNYPQISSYFKSLDTNNTKGKLEENSKLSELKQEEMPWLRDIKGEENKLNELAQLFNDNISTELKTVENKILKNQTVSGGLSWFDGGKENFYISTRVLEIFGKVLHLDKSLINTDMQKAAIKIVNYLDNDSNLYSNNASYNATLDYLYARQYWNQYVKTDSIKINKLQKTLKLSSLISANQSAGIAAKAWISNQLFGTGKISEEIKNRIYQEAVYSEDMGTYWPSNTKMYNNTSLQSYMVEAYKLHNPEKLQNITQWLYYNKQNNNWRTTWMTVDAIYALLLVNNPKDFTLENTIKVTANNEELKNNVNVLGQFTSSFDQKKLVENKHVRIQNNNNRTVYGNIVHQYFTTLDLVKADTNAIMIEKEYYVQRNGTWLKSDTVRLGEKVKVKLTIINDKNIQYVHIKDSRPAGFEPIYQQSGYRWWHGGYYFTAKDASTNYFFDNLIKGKKELEYEVKANNAGVFNAGITTVECMYNPAVHARSNTRQVTITD